jgi:electron transfer flavoprotein beta subunit
MNIIVGLNFLPDANIITMDDGRIDERDLVYMVHPSDLIAVEAAVRLKETNGSGKVSLIALASPSGERLMRRCLSLGADEAILIDYPVNSPEGLFIGMILAEGCKKMDFNLILCGHGSLDNLGGQTGYVMAEQLNLPIITRVTKLDLLFEKKELILEKKLEKGYREKIMLPLPALLTLEEGLNEPRYSSLPDMLEAQKKGIKTINRGDLNLLPEEEILKRPLVELLHLKTPKPRPKRIFTPDTSLSAEERMWQIMSGGAAEKNNKEIFEGSPDDLSLKFVEYLAQLGINPNRG